VIRRLVIRPGAIGDFILSLPAIEFLRRNADYFEVWAASQNVALARSADHAASIVSTGLDWLELPGREPPAGVVRGLRSFDSIISWYGENRPAFRSAVEALNLPFRFLRALPPPGGRVHAADFFLSQAGGEKPAIPRLDCPESPVAFAAIQPFSGSRRKNWPLEKYQRLAARLEKHIPVKWCAGPSEDLPGAVRFDDLYQLACWLRGAAVYVGNDSGITHLAAAAGVPTVALFGPTDPELWAPRGPRVCIIKAEPIERISEEQVYAACFNAASHLLPENCR
jgi:ADP-heptose:LPS heptosyltransferase